MSRFKELKERVYRANLELVEKNLVILTWGNASEIDRDAGVVAIKPSGVDYDKMRAEDMVVVSLGGDVLEGELSPSSDLPSHLELYKGFKQAGGVVHTHSTYATAFAQAGKSLICYGTTHADYFYGNVPCTRELSQPEIERDYEKNTGLVIIEYFARHGIDPLAMPAVLIKSHAPFTWGKDAAKAVENSFVLEQVAKTAVMSMTVNPQIQPVSRELLDKHYFRKHGKSAYYGQKGDKK